jgi:hypothetical protein
MPKNPNKRKCGATTDGRPCKEWAIRGGTVCATHGGRAPQVKAKAAVRAEALDWGLGDSKVDPGEILLRLVTQSAARAQRYSMLLEEAYDAAERLKRAHDAGGLDIDQANPMAETAREDLDRIFNTGGVAALVGNTYGAAKDVGVYVTGEAIRGLADLEAKERATAVPTSQRRRSRQVLLRGKCVWPRSRASCWLRPSGRS